MSAIEFPDYVRRIQSTLTETVAAGHALSIQFQFEQRSTKLGFLTGILFFADGTELHFREYVNLSDPEPRLMYVYHFQEGSGQLVFRYDNALHRPPLPAREHKHTADEIIMLLPPSLEQVIDEILAKRDSFGAK